MTLSDPQPGFQGHCIFRSRISQKRYILGTKLLKYTNRKPYTIYRMVQLSMTLSDLWPRLQGHDIFRHWISQKKRAIVIDLDWPLNASSPLSASAELLVSFCYVDIYMLSILLSCARLCGKLRVHDVIIMCNTYILVDIEFALQSSCVDICIDVFWYVSVETNYRRYVCVCVRV